MSDTGTSKPRGPRPRGSVRRALVEAGVSLARSGGPDAVVLREVTRAVGVVPNAAYRHFNDREALLGAVRDAALAMLAARMADGMNQVVAGNRPAEDALLRLRAVGAAYLAFAREEPGLFDTAFTTTTDLHLSTADSPDPDSPFDHLRMALAKLVDTGVITAERQAVIEYPIWAGVHGTATLLRGPLSSRPEQAKRDLENQVLDLIGSAVWPQPAG
ncbi:MAG: TetR/AcrR family transcriptional regulator [Solirubrobacterales bacterium]|nr:TetR/AcrR family transcriptional regulator [Solirubrobacterales bacterium]